MLTMSSHPLGKIYPNLIVYCISISHHSTSHVIHVQLHLHKKQKKKPRTWLDGGIFSNRRNSITSCFLLGTQNLCIIPFWPSAAHSKLRSAAFLLALQGQASQIACHPYRHLLSIWEESGSATPPLYHGCYCYVSPLNNSTRDIRQSITVNGVTVESHYWKIPPQAKYSR